MAETSQQPLKPGTQIRSFEIREVLGCGGFGITYKAWDHQLECDVAIKEYLPGDLATRAPDQVTVTALPATEDDTETYATGLNKFLNEARTLAKFRSPYLVGVKQFISANGTAYMVMDYEHGRSLAEAVREEGPLDAARLHNLLECLLQGLESLHAHQILHRDIKPANVYLRANGDPVLLDFGSARAAARGPGGDTDLTSMVSMGYAPPEQYSRRGNQGPWTDLYALGATLYFCATGSKPADGMDRYLALKDGWPDPLTPPAELAAGRCPPLLLGIIDWMMRVEIAERPRDTAQVLAVLRGEATLPATGDAAEATQPVAGPRLGDTVVVSEPQTDEATTPPWAAALARLRAGLAQGRRLIGDPRRRWVPAGGAAVLVLLLAWWALQARLTASVEGHLVALAQRATGLTLSVEDVEAPLLGRRLVLHGLRLTNPEGYQARYFLASARAVIVFDQRRWWAAETLPVRGLRLSRPQVSYERHPKTRRSNLLEIQRALPPAPAGGPALRPGALRVAGGELQAVSFPKQDEIVTRELPPLEVPADQWQAATAGQWVREVVLRLDRHALKAARQSRILRRTVGAPAVPQTRQGTAAGKAESPGSGDITQKLKEIFSKPPSDVFPEGEEDF